MIRWFNRTIENVPTTLTLLVGGIIVWPCVFIALAWLGLVVWLGVGQILGLRA